MNSLVFPSHAWAPQHVERECFDDGSFVLRSPHALEPYARCIGEWVEHWAAQTPDAIALAERAADGAWRQLSWRALRTAIGSVGQRLLNLKLPASRPIVVLSDNSIDHALLMLGAMHVGLAVCTVSSAYSRPGSDHAKIRVIVDTLQPALIYASDAPVYAPAIGACRGDATVVLSAGADAVPGAMAFASFLNCQEGPEVMEKFGDIQPDDHAKYLLTSGSTGQPKVVINTHRMLCANQQMIAQTWRFLSHERPRLVDWLPWSHTFGGNHNLNLVLRNGGTLHIDEGRPAPHAIEKTIRNLGEVRPTLLFNVPAGFDMMLPYLERDEQLARDVMSRLQMIFYAGAALPPSTWARLQTLADRSRGSKVWLTTSWGSTETAPAVTSAHWELEGAGCIGLPLPGNELKFVPNGAKLELRVRGVSVFPGYRGAPKLTADAFDGEGYYRIGDAGYLVDDMRPERGIVFDGRVAEDFKLATGTWVSVGTLRTQLVSAFAPYAQDLVITGPDRSEIGLLFFPSARASELPRKQLEERLRAVLESLAKSSSGSSRCPGRLMVMSEPPSVQAGEITDKGYINQREVLARRRDRVEALYAELPSADVIRVPRVAR